MGPRAAPCRRRWRGGGGAGRRRAGGGGAAAGAVPGDCGPAPGGPRPVRGEAAAAVPVACALRAGRKIVCECFRRGPRRMIRRGPRALAASGPQRARQGYATAACDSDCGGGGSVRGWRRRRRGRSGGGTRRRAPPPGRCWPAKPCVCMSPDEGDGAGRVRPARGAEPCRYEGGPCFARTLSPVPPVPCSPNTEGWVGPARGVRAELSTPEPGPSPGPGPGADTGSRSGPARMLRLPVTVLINCTCRPAAGSGCRACRGGVRGRRDRRGCRLPCLAACRQARAAKAFAGLLGSTESQTCRAEPQLRGHRPVVTDLSESQTCRAQPQPPQLRGPSVRG